MADSLPPPSSSDSVGQPSAASIGDEPINSTHSTARGPVLYRHALECIFAFSSLADLARISAVSLDWSSAVLRMPSARVKFILPSASGRFLLSASESKLARHIIEIGAASGCSPAVHIDCASLSIISQRMPQLERLSVDLILPQDASAAAAVASLEFPRRLLDLAVAFSVTLRDESVAGSPMMPSFRAAITDIFFRFAGCDNEAAPLVLRPSASLDDPAESEPAAAVASSSSSSSSRYYPRKTMSRLDLASYILSCGAGQVSASDERMIYIFTK
jgi:hypothetical protein